jgi:hypothetical protein
MEVATRLALRILFQILTVESSDCVKRAAVMGDREGELVASAARPPVHNLKKEFCNEK